MTSSEFLYKVNEHKVLCGIVAACNGTETPIRHDNVWYLYVHDFTDSNSYYIDIVGRVYQNPFGV